MILKPMTCASSNWPKITQTLEKKHNKITVHYYKTAYFEGTRDSVNSSVFVTTFLAFIATHHINIIWHDLFSILHQAKKHEYDIITLLNLNQYF